MAAATTNGTAVKRDAESLDETTPPKKPKEDLTPKEEALSNLQYRHIPYQEQLKKKQEETQAISKEFNNVFIKRYPQFAAWYKGIFLETRYKFDQIMTSPKTFAYRNKCELTIGFNPELNKLCAGPRISDGADGKVQVGPCDQDLIHLTPSMIEIAQDFSNFLDKWNYLEEKCPWYNLFIRATKSGDHMLIFILKEDTQETLKELKTELIKYYTEDYDKKHAIKSIYLQPKAENSTKKSYELEFLHAHGDEFLIEDILDLKLIVTPSIYFRINSFAAEITYQKVLDVGDLKKKRTLVLDLWCGCGALTLLAAKKAAYVVGIDPSKWNIKKAQFMARYNKIKNVEFIIARPEDGIKQIWRNLQDVEEIVIFADPPTLCKMTELGDLIADIPHVSRFIYIHSSHKLHFVKNMMNLTQASLLPTRFIPVDVSPHSVRVELIALLRKVNPYDEKAAVGPRGGGPLPNADPSYIEEIERRAFAMGMAKAMQASGGGYDAPRGGYDAPRGGYDSYGDYGYGGQSRNAGGSWKSGGYGGGAGGGYGGGAGGGYGGGYGGGAGGGYGGGRKYDEGRQGSGFGGGSGGFGPSGFGPDADSYIGGFKGYGGVSGRGAFKSGFRGKRGGR